MGRHAITGKAISPLSPVANPERFRDAAKVEKWFKRNCSDTLGRGVALETSDPGRVPGDAALLEALVRNLVDNALRHGGHHGEVRVKLVRQDRAIRLTVEDTGPGVTPETLERLGWRFYRAADTTATGSGLGLSIVQRIAQLHGGTVSFRNGDADRGLRVDVSIPIEASGRVN
jgi:signal transduction histidine kinase